MDTNFNFDFDDWIIWNGGVDARKLVTQKEEMIKRCKKKWGEYKTDHFGYYTPEENRQFLIDRATPEELKFKKKLDELKQKDNKYDYVFQKIIRMPTGKYYIVDFYLPFKNLIIEIDGPYHKWTRQQFADDMRTQNLKNMGFKIKRITNEELNKHI